MANLRVSFHFTGMLFDTVTQIYTLIMTVSWDLPDYPNGVIASYEVNVIQSDTSSAIVYTNNSVTATSVAQLVMVLPFTNYTVTVTASTSSGQGENSAIIIESPEAGRRILWSLPPLLYSTICT